MLDDPIATKYFWQTMVGFLPATLFFVGIGTFFTGAFPKLTNVLWIYLAASVLVKMFGPLLNLSDDVANFSPLGWVGKVPTESVDNTVMIVLVSAFLVLTLLGIVGYNKRDLE